MLGVRSINWVGKAAFLEAPEENAFPCLLQILGAARFVTMYDSHLYFHHHVSFPDLTLLFPPCKGPCEYIGLIQETQEILFQILNSITCEKKLFATEYPVFTGSGTMDNFGETPFCIPHWPIG